ncbi:MULTISPECIES: MFS transporter [unclassified Arcicella]|uniref:MFS transporter n=1 Tax=unclassified Arcicella TaxID=2644986 RepID=UPI0028647E1D|nr:MULTISPECIES: MFS transporter [unclassified Arcicella]MDR6564494.1 NNP family nitrate/nitrite transporter-like MFS transporter [Arcicella sp. BE51]MDR6814353.1 NNP family nitrate/nitrite transporter-like MFS transporter [Arcicella sp. BE140]MDR6825625.1 NNP family nitrate/nitrite transporter-like MFS transporter [Arcicella sp. BE139]
MKNISTNKPLDALNVFSFKGIQMQTFHITWLTFFFCFFGWFGIAPLMKIVKDDLGLTKGQIGNIIIASVSATIFARLIIGRLCDTLGPRLTYTWLLAIGSIPVMTIGLANSYESFLLFRLAISVIGASFVITQYHTSAMFAPSIKGTANAVAGGWGNLGGGVTNMVMPLVFAAFVGAGYANHNAWRFAMIIPGVILLIMSFVYYKFTQDTPTGNYANIEREAVQKGSFASAASDYRTWILFLAYGACFGIEITFDNVAALYFTENFSCDLKTAGLLAGAFGFMNLFARAIGGIVADKVGKVYGMKGKGWLLAGLLVMEGLGIMLFAQTGSIGFAVIAMLGFAMFLKMANGATYAIVPFIDSKNVGSVAGIVGAGGNLGGVLAGFLFKSETITYAEAFIYIGISVAVIGGLTALIKFEKKTLPVTEQTLEIA